MSTTTILEDLVPDTAIAAELKRHPRTIARWSDKPDGMPYVRLGNRRLYHPPTVREWLMAKMHRPNPRRTSAA